MNNIMCSNVKRLRGWNEMAKLNIGGFDKISMTMEELGKLPESVLDEMLLAEAEVVLKAQKSKGRAYGVHKTGVTLNSIKVGKPRKAKDGKSISVLPAGTNATGNRNAEVAFVNEYGKKGQPARPFIRDANEGASEGAVSAAEKVYIKWLESL